MTKSPTTSRDAVRQHRIRSARIRGQARKPVAFVFGMGLTVRSIARFITRGKSLEWTQLQHRGLLDDLRKVRWKGTRCNCPIYLLDWKMVFRPIGQFGTMRTIPNFDTGVLQCVWERDQFRVCFGLIHWLESQGAPPWLPRFKRKQKSDPKPELVNARGSKADGKGSRIAA